MFYSPLSGRFYASQHYREKANAVVITGAMYDVTNDIGAAVAEYDLEFTPAERSESDGE